MTRRERIAHWTKWAIAVPVIVMTLLAAVPLWQTIRTNQEKQAARDIVWNEVSYPQGNVGTVVPDQVKPGGSVTVTYKEYCNAGVDVISTNWLDFLGVDGEPVAAYSLPTVEFYGSKFIDRSRTSLTKKSPPDGCTQDQAQPIGIPATIAGRPPGFASVRIRTITTYVKPEQVIRVLAFSEPFLLLPQADS